MTTDIRSTLIVPLTLFVGVAPVFGQEPDVASALDAPARYAEDRLSTEFHRGRREAVLEVLPDDAVAVILSAPTRQRSNDVDYQYR